MEARAVVAAGGVVGTGRRGAPAVDLPRSLARDDPALDRSEARDPSGAVPVSEARAAGLAVAARAVRAPAPGAAARAGADAAATTGAPAARPVAVHVVAIAAEAVARPRDLPPPTDDRAGRARVGAVDRAAELRVAIAAEGATGAGRARAAAHGPVGRDRAKRKVERVGGGGRRHQRRGGQEPASREAAIEEVGGPVGQIRQRHRSPVWHGGHLASGGVHP